MGPGKGAVQAASRPYFPSGTRQNLEQTIPRYTCSKFLLCKSSFLMCMSDMWWEVHNCWHLMERKRACGSLTCLIGGISTQRKREKISVPKDSKRNKGLFWCLGNFLGSLERFLNYKPDVFFASGKAHKPFLSTHEHKLTLPGQGGCMAPLPAVLEPVRVKIIKSS